MTQKITSKELLTRANISRATLNNYIARGLLPKPEVMKPAAEDGAAKRLGYFPVSTLDKIVRIKRLKSAGKSFKDIELVMTANSPVEGSTPREERSMSQSDSKTTAQGNENIADDVARPRNDNMQREFKLLDLGQGTNLSIDQVEMPAYMVNNKVEVEWSNQSANERLFGPNKSLSEDISECSFFTLALNSPTVKKAADRLAIIGFHLAATKNRLPRSALYELGNTLEPKELDELLETYAVVEPLERGAVAHTTVNMAPLGEEPVYVGIYASFFREGIFFAHAPAEDASDTLIELLGRREIVIRELLRKRRPYFTPLSVLVADIQNSVKICAELPPEEYFELINQIWSAMEPMLRTYHATHGKHVGDGVLYYFFPQPDSNYVVNAIRCAQEMRQEMITIDNEWKRRKNWSNTLRLNIGLDEGQEWFGAYRTATHLEFTVLGDTINRAGRLSDFAQAGTIWATKNLIGQLGQKDRESINYGIHRESEGLSRVLIPETFSRISNLVDLDAPENHKLNDLGALPVTEILP